MPELNLPQPPKVEELPPRAPAAPDAVGPLYTDEPGSSPDWSWLGGLVVMALLFYFFAPASWKAWVVDRWQNLPWDKLPVEVSVKVKNLPVSTVSPTPSPTGGQPSLWELPAPPPEERPGIPTVPALPTETLEMTVIE